jgi:hypothetical protein
MAITYQRTSQNLGMAGNFLKIMEMSDTEFTWILGDDDLVVPDGVERICGLLDQHPASDFFYVNAFHLTTEYVLSHPQPFSTTNLPARMEPFSPWTTDGELPFLDLIDPRISFDFLGGIFLAVFRTAKWRASAGVLNQQEIANGRTFSTFDNTFPHMKIFAHAFAGSTAYFNVAPVGVCLTGAREWAPMYPMIRSVLLLEALREYRKTGLSLRRYLWCKNFALRTFIPDFVYMLTHRESSGFQYVNPAKLVLNNCLYPNFYLSVWYYIARKVKTAFASRIATTRVAATHS